MPHNSTSVFPVLFEQLRDRVELGYIPQFTVSMNRPDLTSSLLTRESVGKRLNDTYHVLRPLERSFSHSQVLGGCERLGALGTTLSVIGTPVFVDNRTAPRLLIIYGDDVKHCVRS